MFNNRLKESVHTNHALLGVRLVFADPDSAELIGRIGFDWAWIDWQHGQWCERSIQEALSRFNGLRTAPIVRVKSLDPGQINWALDMGAKGVIVPMVQDASMARSAVEASHYAPIGQRSIGGTRLRDPSTFSNRGYIERANDEIAVIVMVETETAVDNIDEIMGVPHVDAVLIGPTDLLHDVKSRGQDEGHFESLLQRVVDASKRHGVPVGYHCLDAVSSRSRIEQGFHLMACTTDEMVLIQGLREILEATR